MLEDRDGDGRQPQLRPRKRGHGQERQLLLPEDLVADRLVEEVPDRQAGGAPLLLVQDALGFQQKRLAEPLRPDDDELVVAVETEEGVDLGRPVQQRVVEIFGDPDVVGVHGPRAHILSPRAEVTG